MRPPEVKQVKPLEIMIVAGILLLAAFVRFNQLGVSEYKLDEATQAQLALEIANGDSFPLLNMTSSIGLPFPPFGAYVLVPPFWVSSNPLVATYYVALTNVLAVGLTYWLARRYVGIPAAIVAALLLAVNFWAVFHSRKLWMNNFLPLFATLTVFTGLLAYYEGKKWAQWIHLPILAVTVQIHYSGVIFLPVTAYLLFRGRDRINRRFWISGTLALLLFIPLVMGWAEAGLFSLDKIRERLNANPDNESRHLALSGAGLEMAGLVLGGRDIHSLAGGEAFKDYLSRVPDLYPLFNLAALLILVAAGWLIWRRIRRQEQRRVMESTVLLWGLGVPLVFSLGIMDPIPVYYLPMMPAAYLAVGLLAQKIWDSGGRVVIGLGGVLLAGYVLGQVGLQTVLWGFLDTHSTPGGFGTPIHYLLDVRDDVLGQNPEQVIVDVGGQSIGIDGDATVWHTLLYNVPRVGFTDASTMVYPAGDVVFLTNNCSSDQLIAPETLSLRDADGCYAVDHRSRDDLDVTQFQTMDAPRFANGVQLIGAQWQLEEQTCLNILWQIEAGPVDDDFMFAVHLFNADDERVAVADGLSWSGRYWRPGDLVVRQFCVPEPETAVSYANVGMYTYDGVQFFTVGLEGTDETAVQIPVE